jgi:predicted RNA-binding protein YlxR (DUF448 family)
MIMVMRKMNISKHIPLRMCISCHQTMNKRHLVRLVRNADGSVQVDPSGKKSGRGAYLCHSRECWHNAFNSSRLEHALKTSITPENREQLVNSGNNLASDN